MDSKGYEVITNSSKLLNIMEVSPQPQPGEDVRFLSIGKKYFLSSLAHEDVLNSLDQNGLLEGAKAHNSPDLPLLHMHGITKDHILFEDLNYGNRTIVQE
jgi:hypothetical protein